MLYKVNYNPKVEQRLSSNSNTTKKIDYKPKSTNKPTKFSQLTKPSYIMA